MPLAETLPAEISSPVVILVRPAVISRPASQLSASLQVQPSPATAAKCLYPAMPKSALRAALTDQF
jgi:hypothetical protein